LLYHYVHNGVFPSLVEITAQWQPVGDCHPSAKYQIKVIDGPLRGGAGWPYYSAGDMKIFYAYDFELYASFIVALNHAMKNIDEQYELHKQVVLAAFDKLEQQRKNLIKS